MVILAIILALAGFVSILAGIFVEGDTMDAKIFWSGMGMACMFGLSVIIYYIGTGDGKDDCRKVLAKDKKAEYKVITLGLSDKVLWRVTDSTLVNTKNLLENDFN